MCEQAAARYLHLTQSYERVVTELKPLSKRQELMRRAMNNDSASADDSAARNAAIDAAAQQELRDAAMAAAAAASKAGSARGPPMDSSAPFSGASPFDDDVDNFQVASPAFVDVTASPVPAPPPRAPEPNVNSYQSAPQQQRVAPDFSASSASQASPFGQRNTVAPGGAQVGASSVASSAHSSAAAPYAGGEVVAWTPVVMGGCVGTNAASVNGIYVPTGDLYNGKPLYQKQGDPSKWLRFVASNARWSVGTREDKDLQNAHGWCESIEAHASLPTQVRQWQAYSDCSWGLQPSCSCVAPGVDAVATLQAELAAAREQLLAAQQQSQHTARYEANAAQQQQQQQQVARDQVSALEAAAKAQRMQQLQQQQEFLQQQQQQQRSMRDMPAAAAAAAAAAPRADFTWQDPPIPPPSGNSGGYRNVQAANIGSSSSSSPFGGTGAAAAAASEMRGGSGGNINHNMHGNIGGGGHPPSSSSSSSIGLERALAPLMGKQWVSSYNNELFDVSADGNLCKNGKPTDPLTLVGSGGGASCLAFGSWRLSDAANHHDDNDVIVWRNPGHSLDPITWRTLESVMLQPLVGKRWISSFKAESFDVASSGTLRKNGRPTMESICVATGEPLYGSHGGLGSRHAPPILMTFGAWTADLAASSTDEIQWRNPGDPMDPIIWRAAAVADSPAASPGMMNAGGGGMGAKASNDFWSSQQQQQQQQPFSDHQALPSQGGPGESVLRNAFISFRGMDGAR